MSKINLSKSIKNTKRVGRGPGSGKGKTSGRGMSGQRSRTGASTSRIEGGQTKLIMRLPKKNGFASSKKPTSITLTTDQINSLFSGAEKVGKEDIIKKVLGSKSHRIEKVKVIKGRSELDKIKLLDDILLSASLGKSEKVIGSK